MGSLRTTQEFREELLRHMERNDERWKTTEKFIDETRKAITSGEACVVGAKHEARLSLVEEDVQRQWKMINLIKRPARKAVAWSVGGTAGMIGLVEVVRTIWTAWNGGKP